MSRNGNTFRNFKALAHWIGDNLPVENVVIDGEIACVDDSGRWVPNDLLFRRQAVTELDPHQGCELHTQVEERTETFEDRR